MYFFYFSIYFILSYLHIVLSFEPVFPSFPNITSVDEPGLSSVHPSGHFDVGICACDISNLCIFGCCCDPDCSSDIVKEWEERGICTGIKKKNVNSGNMCGIKNSKQKKYDQFFNLFCIHRDNSPDMGYFYKYENEISSEALEELSEKWLNKYSPTINQNNDGYLFLDNIYYVNAYGEYNMFFIFDYDSNGICVGNKAVKYLDNFENSCTFRASDYTDDNINMNLFSNTTTKTLSLYNKGDNNIVECNNVIIEGEINDIYIKEYRLLIVYNVTTIKNCFLFLSLSKEPTYNMIQSLSFVSEESEFKESSRGYNPGDPLRFIIDGKRFNEGIKIIKEKQVIKFKVDSEHTYPIKTENTTISSLMSANSIYIERAYFSENDYNSVIKGKYENNNNIVKVNMCPSGNYSIYIFEILTTKVGSDKQTSNVIKSCRLKCLYDKKSKLEKIKVKFVEIPYYLYDRRKMREITSLHEFPSYLLGNSLYKIIDN